MGLDTPILVYAVLDCLLIFGAFIFGCFVGVGVTVTKYEREALETLKASDTPHISLQVLLKKSHLHQN